RTSEQRPSRSTGSQEALTQSERDWAYAKRALARGDDPEEIVRRIADYRADEKHDPQYYARHTVTKAQEELRSARDSLHGVQATPEPENQAMQDDPSRPDFS